MTRGAASERRFRVAPLPAWRTENAGGAAGSATAEKMNLRRRIRTAQLDHLVSVARFASREVPELTRKFRLGRGQMPNLEFRTVARGLMAEAESQKDVLVKHGLDETVLASLAASLDELAPVRSKELMKHRCSIRSPPTVVADTAPPIRGK